MPHQGRTQLSVANGLCHGRYAAVSTHVSHAVLAMMSCHDGSCKTSITRLLIMQVFGWLMCTAWNKDGVEGNRGRNKGIQLNTTFGAVYMLSVCCFGVCRKVHQQGTSLRLGNHLSCSNSWHLVPSDQVAPLHYSNEQDSAGWVWYPTSCSVVNEQQLMQCSMNSGCSDCVFQSSAVLQCMFHGPEQLSCSHQILCCVPSKPSSGARATAAVLLTMQKFASRTLEKFQVVHW